MRTDGSLPRYVEVVRVSTKGQVDADTPEMQKRALDELAKRRPGVRVERIEANGVSGALPLSQRPDLRRLQALSQGRLFDEIRVYALDRLTRSEDPRERMAVWGMAADADAVIVDTTGRLVDPLDISGMGELDFFLSTFFASQERKRIRRRTTDGKRRLAALGRLVTGSPTHGLRHHKGSWTFEPREAAVVRQIFSLCAQGQSTNAIADRLSAEGHPTANGGRWRQSTVARMLRCRTYRGDFSQVVGDDTIRSEIPALVEIDVFDRAQSQLDSRKGGRAPQSADALLRGLLRCGECGLNMHTTSQHRGRHRYYRCACRNSAVRADPCANVLHPIAELDDVVWRVLVDKLRHAEDIITSAAGAVDAATGADWDERLASTAERLAKLSQSERNTLRFSEDGLLSDAVCRTRLQEIQADRKTLEADRRIAEQAKARHASVARMRATFTDRMAAIRDRLDGAEFTTRRAIVDAIVPNAPGYGVTVYADGRVEIIGILDFDTGPSGSAAEGGTSNEALSNDAL